MKRRFYCLIILIVVTIALLYSFANITYAESTLYIEQAQDLKTLGLFKGTDKGFELERSPTRAEGAVMMVRLLGEEKYALSSNFTHPFTDVPLWADPYVGYMYQFSLTNGMSSTIYGSSLPLSDIQFVTFVLRALGYDDKKNDFNYKYALEKSLEIGLLNEQEISEIEGLPVFLRNNVAYICYRSLTANLKDTNRTLIEKLIFDEGAVSLELAQTLGLLTVEGYADYIMTFQVNTNDYGYVVNNFDDMVEVLEKSIYQFDGEIRIDINNYGADTYTDFENAINIALENVKEFTGLRNILSSYNYSGTYKQVEVNLIYLDSKQYLETQKQQLLTARIKARETINSIIKPDMSEFEKELAIHNYIVNNTVYDYENFINDVIPEESYTYYGVLVLGKAVCQGYAEAMKLMFDLAGLESIVIIGESYSYGNWVGHAWNIVKIDNQYYHIDATFNDPVTQSPEQILRYTYFNITDDEISQNHSWISGNYPECNSSISNYYKVNNLVVQDFEEFKTRIQQAINNNEQEIELKIISFIEGEYNNLSDIIFESGKVSSYSWSIDKNFGIIQIKNILYH